MGWEAEYVGGDSCDSWCDSWDAEFVGDDEKLTVAGEVDREENEVGSRARALLKQYGVLIPPLEIAGNVEKLNNCRLTAMFHSFIYALHCSLFMICVSKLQ